MKCLSFRASLGLWAMLECCSLHAAPADPCVAAYQNRVAGKEVPPASVFAVISQEQQIGCISGPTDTTGVEQLTRTLREAKTGSEKAAARQMLVDRAITEFDDVSMAPSCSDNT